ncbi:FAD-binding protein, partial [Clostridium perfringens]
RADILLIPESKDQVIKTIENCREKNIPFYVVGNGSNLLVKDGGLKGVVIKLNEVKNIKIVGDIVEAECGAMLKDVSNTALISSLTGFEFACGIPGTVGGAVFMNAGANNGEIAHEIVSAEVIDDTGNIITLSKDDLELGYRSSI